jgi:hypothetical protein
MRPLRREGPSADVKWNEGVLLIRRSQTIGDDMMETTKTDLHQRLHLPAELLDVLRWHVDTQLNDRMRASELLFPSIVGRFRSRSCLDKPFANVAKTIGLGYTFTARGMRRTYQDLAREAGIHDAVTRAISGHTTQECNFALDATRRRGTGRDREGRRHRDSRRRCHRPIGRARASRREVAGVSIDAKITGSDDLNDSKPKFSRTASRF